MDAQGEPAKLLTTVPDFDARTRPWYTRAVVEGQAVWSAAYVLFTGQDMAIAASRPVFDTQGQLLGVVSVDLFLSHLNSFLSDLKFGDTGQGFIMKRSGWLIASSLSDPLFLPSENGQSFPRRLLAGESQNILVRKAAEAMLNRFGQYLAISGTAQLEYDIEGERHFLLVSPVQDSAGLDWLVVAVVPEADFMSRINHLNRTTIVLIVVAMIFAVICGVVAANWISHPITRLTRSARDMAQGMGRQTVSENRPIAEIGELTRSFNKMAGQLQQMLDELIIEVSERKQTEAALRSSEERVELVLKGARIGYWDWYVQTGDVFFNDHWFEMLGYTPDEIKPHVSSWQKLLQPADAERVSKMLKDHLENRTPVYETEHRLRTKSGGWKWILDSGQVFERDEHGSPVRALGIHLDITFRKQVEEKLHRAIKEKEVLLKGIHHRVKNNLAVITSLLNLQAKRSTDTNVRKSLIDSQARVRAMSLIHEALYQNDDIFGITFDRFDG